MSKEDAPFNLVELMQQAYYKSIEPRRPVVYYLSLQSLEFHANVLGISVDKLKKRFNLEALDEVKNIKIP